MAKQDDTLTGGDKADSITGGSGKNAAAPVLTKRDVADMFRGMHKVTIPAVGKDGKPQTMTDPDGTGRRYKTETVDIRAEHILGFRVAGRQLTATTIDGQKLTAELR